MDPKLLGFSVCQTLSEKAIEGQQISTTKQAKWMGRKKPSYIPFQKWFHNSNV